MTAPLSAVEVAALVGGWLIGDGSVRLGAVAPLDRAGPGDLSFLAGGRYLPSFHATRAGAVLCSPEHQSAEPGPATRIIVEDPHRAVQRVLRALFPPPPRRSGVDPSATVGRGAVLGRDVYLGPHVVIGSGAALGDRADVMAGAVIGAGVQIGDDVTIHPHVVCYPGTTVGSRVILHAGVRLGVDGFGYVPGPTGHERVPHVGRCVIGDDVEIGANSTVDRGSVDDTVVGAGTKIDNLVHIGHNCRIGQRCLIMAQVGMAGSTYVEDDVILAGQAGLAGHLTVARRARIGAQSGVIGDVSAGATVSGYPARAHRDVMRATSAMYRLAEIVDELEAMVEHGRRAAE
ncbi:MAG: UDP-3-O-(3-hydroxymyristoyl)glucosamine N-acyltransferase [Gemmatimonadetes bacterium]|nr:UDP-3-O-(3-hydroxymyristoyl)glucosamine N-acyltransferase [Gemmatimonadota bacterium]